MAEARRRDAIGQSFNRPQPVNTNELMPMTIELTHQEEADIIERRRQALEQDQSSRNRAGIYGPAHKDPFRQAFLVSLRFDE